MTKDIFHYDGLRAFFEEMSVRTNFFPLRDWHGQPGVILRHDVDLDVEPARRLAEIENMSGLRSTFFFMISSDFYNPISSSNRGHLRRMAEGGFEIGLHFDPMVYGDIDNESLAVAARTEARLLEDAVGVPVCSISLHNPSLLGKYPLFSGWNNAYDPAIFASDIYLSDSRMLFRHDPRRFLERASERTCQLLLHPLHYSEHGFPYPSPMLDRVRHFARNLDEKFQVNETYNRLIGTRFAGLLAEHLSKAAVERGKPASTG